MLAFWKRCEEKGHDMGGIIQNSRQILSKMCKTRANEADCQNPLLSNHQGNKKTFKHVYADRTSSNKFKVLPLALKESDSESNAGWQSHEGSLSGSLSGTKQREGPILELRRDLRIKGPAGKELSSRLF